MNEGKYSVARKSGNVKIGVRCAVTTSPRQTCPLTCPFLGNGCYADNFPMSDHWDRLTNGTRGVTWEEHIELIRKLPEGRCLRVNQAGDLPGNDGKIDREKALELAEAASGKMAWGYTHHLPTEENLGSLSEMADRGLVMNLSANSPKHGAALAKATGLPVTCVAPEDFKSQEVDGVRVVLCPAMRNKHVSCSGGTVKVDWPKMTKPEYRKTVACGGPKGPLCARRDRNYVIAFPVHGAKRKIAQKVTESFNV